MPVEPATAPGWCHRVSETRVPPWRERAALSGRTPMKSRSAEGESQPVTIGSAVKIGVLVVLRDISVVDHRADPVGDRFSAGHRD